MKKITGTASLMVSMEGVGFLGAAGLTLFISDRFVVHENKETHKLLYFMGSMYHGNCGTHKVSYLIDICHRNYKTH